MHKTTLLAMSWAIEDQVAALAERALMWGSFQKPKFYSPSTSRWRDLGRACSGVTVFADFARSDPHGSPRKVALPANAPLTREWAVVVDSPSFPVALSAWELPGQTGVTDRSRMFETMWTLDPVAVRDAARVCAEVARDIDPVFGEGIFATPPPLDPHEHEQPSLARVTGLFTRMAAYVDRFAPINQQVSIPPLAGSSD
jgi:MerR family transcriptional regulator, light-induced transcriptional regulator